MSCLTIFVIGNNEKRQSRRFGSARNEFLILLQASFDYRMDVTEMRGQPMINSLIFFVECADSFVN